MYYQEMHAVVCPNYISSEHFVFFVPNCCSLQKATINLALSWRITLFFGSLDELIIRIAKAASERCLRTAEAAWSRPARPLTQQMHHEHHLITMHHCISQSRYMSRPPGLPSRLVHWMVLVQAMAQPSAGLLLHPEMTTHEALPSTSLVFKPN